jgi:hypothetical protein
LARAFASSLRATTSSRSRCSFAAAIARTSSVADSSFATCGGRAFIDAPWVDGGICYEVELSPFFLQENGNTLRFSIRSGAWNLHSQRVHLRARAHQVFHASKVLDGQTRLLRWDVSD